jgi:ABC-2 type transport system ATP-binding protein
MSSSDKHRRVREMVRVCGLNAEKHKKIGELSKGYRQRVGLAQAMIHDPQVLVLDEPTTGLDPNQIVEIRNLIRELGKEKTVVLSTHILPEVEATCDRILIINKGKIVADGTASNLRQAAQGQEIHHLKIVTDSLTNALEQIRKLSTVQSATILDSTKNKIEFTSKPNMAAIREVWNLCVQNNWMITELIPFETKLEDIFRDLTMN